jgi:hypothetical protein
VGVGTLPFLVALAYVTIWPSPDHVGIKPTETLIAIDSLVDGWVGKLADDVPGRGVGPTVCVSISASFRSYALASFNL